jgi:hypothetical protein
VPPACPIWPIPSLPRFNTDGQASLLAMEMAGAADAPH